MRPNCDSLFSNPAPESQGIFETVTQGTPLQQGDVVFSSPYVYPYFDEGVLDVWSQNWSVIILTHSCDLENDKVDLVIVCPIWEINDYFQDCAIRFKTDQKYQDNFKNQRDFKNSITNLIKDAAEDKRYGYTVLKGAALPEIETEPLLVDFTNIYSLPLDVIDTISKTDKKNLIRLRLKTEFKAGLIAKFSYFLLRSVLSKSEFDYKKDIEPLLNFDVIDEILSGNFPK